MLERVVSRAWSLPPRRNDVTVTRRVEVPMSDGVVLLADHFAPVTRAPAATVLVRCPYGRGAPYDLITARLVAERGYHVLLQSCRGTFGSGGVFDPMRHEAADGQDTVAWLRGQDWFDGRLATMGMSYLGFVQWALALDPPPELVASVVQVGPHDFGRTAYRNGAFDLYNFLSWSDLVARQEHLGPAGGLWRMATADRRLSRSVSASPIGRGARALLGAGAPWFEGWLEHPVLTDPFWEPLRCGAALARTTAPTLLVGGWHDLFLEQTIEQYRTLRDRGVPARLVVGPWAHLDVSVRGGTAMAETIAWLDRHAGAGGPARGPVRVRVGGAGEWRELADWPPPGARGQSWYLGAGGTLSTRSPDAGAAPATFRYDPAHPTPSVGGAVMSLRAGARDNRAVERRPDVLVFTSGPLAEPLEVLGEVRAELSVTRDNPHADVFVRLCDVDARGRSRNVCDGIVRLGEADPLRGTVVVSLLGAAHRFARGHRVRVQVSGGAHPRFARNPGTGGVDAAAGDLVGTTVHVGLGADAASRLVLPTTRAVGEAP